MAPLHPDPHQADRRGPARGEQLLGSRSATALSTVLELVVRDARTRDGVVLSVALAVSFGARSAGRTAIDPAACTDAIASVARTSLRSAIARTDLDTLLADREHVGAEFRAVVDAQLDTPSRQLGITIDRVDVIGVDPAPAERGNEPDGRGAPR